MKHNTADAAPKPKVIPPASIPSEFSFTGWTGWWQGATNKTSMALFHRTDGCFTSVQHKTGTIAADKAKFQKTEDDLIGNGYTIVPGASVTVPLQTSTGIKQYELQQSSVTTPAGAEKIMGGQEFGYLQLSKGYVFVEGYCDTPAELPATIPALQAIKFDGAQ